MCLLLFAYRQHPDFPLIVAANRDEYHQRRSAPAHWWPDGILAGRDLEAGGTWLGLTRQGRFAVVTNYRDLPGQQPGRPSRGALVHDLLARGAGADALPWLRAVGGDYNGFNLVFGDADQVCSFANRGEEGGVALAPGLYGLSNHLLETPWPKVRRGKALLRDYLSAGAAPATEPLLELLGDRTRPDDDQLPQTGVGLEWERLLSPMFIVDPRYGTRASTAIVMRRDGEVFFSERSFGPDGEALGTVEFRLSSGR